MVGLGIVTMISHALQFQLSGGGWIRNYHESVTKGGKKHLTMNEILPMARDIGIQSIKHRQGFFYFFYFVL